jgi:ABC-type multidrug transport system fused ATPase/permease subunit
LIDRATARLLKGRTGIIIAHRLHTVQKADMIMILESGAIQEIGLRRDLLANPASRFSALLKTGLEEMLA